jgi:hypothetical protein
VAAFVCASNGLRDAGCDRALTEGSHGQLDRRQIHGYGRSIRSSRGSAEAGAFRDTVTAFNTPPVGPPGDGQMDQREDGEMEQTTHRCTAASIGATLNKCPPRVHPRRARNHDTATIGQHR